MQAATVVAGLTGVAAPSAHAEFNGYGTVATEYVWRGFATSGGNPSVQLAFDYQHQSGFFAGAWAATIDIANPQGGHRNRELDYYAGYFRDAPGDWSTTLTLVRYTYPGARGYRSYDHTEWLASAQWSDRVYVEFGYSPDAYGAGRAGRHLQVGTRFELPGGWILSGALGRNDLSALGVSTYVYGDLGLSATFHRVTMDVRWYDSQRFGGGGFAGYAAGTRLVGSVSVAF